jgi:hypothetical protein
MSLKHLFMSSILGQLFWIKAYKQKDLDEELNSNICPKTMEKQHNADCHALKVESKSFRFCNAREKRDYLNLKKKLTTKDPIL